MGNVFVKVFWNISRYFINGREIGMDKPTSGVIPQQKHGLVLQLYMVTMTCLCKSFKLQGFFCGTCYMLYLLIEKPVFDKRFKACQNKVWPCSNLKYKSHMWKYWCNKNTKRNLHVRKRLDLIWKTELNLHHDHMQNYCVNLSSWIWDESGINHLENQLLLFHWYQ